MTDAIRTYQVLAALRHVRRFARLPVVQPQNVAEHCYYTALLACCFSKQLGQRGVFLDERVVVEAALFHDAAEAFTGDLPHEVKRWSAELHKVWDQMEQGVLERLKQFCWMLPLPQASSLEKRVVKVADWVELILYVQSEADLGNHALDIAAVRIWEYLLSPDVTAMMCNEHGAGVAGWYMSLLSQLQETAPPKFGSVDLTRWGAAEGG